MRSLAPDSTAPVKLPYLGLRHLLAPLIRLKLILLVLMGCWLGAPALSLPAQPETVRLEANTQQIGLAGHMSYLIDPAGKLGLEEVMARRASGAFILSTESEIPAGYLPQGAVWVYLRLERDAGAPRDWWMEAGEDLLDEITHYEI